VVHCAASLTGDSAAHQRDTVGATQTLVQAIKAQPTPPRLVLVSSLVVYDYEGLAPGSEITESTPLAQSGRDAYATAKLAQEAAARVLPSAWLLRAGIIYGPGRSWNAHIGAGLGPVLVRIGGAGELPLIHVQDCAEAMIHAAVTPPNGARALNIVGDDLPDRTRFLTAHRASGWPRLTLPLPWQVLLALSKILQPIPGLPGLLRPGPIKARMMPLSYSNAAAKAALGWSPRIPFEAGMAASLRGAA
jgi:nucleoside-diphosphate-sugar epimerase